MKILYLVIFFCLITPIAIVIRTLRIITLIFNKNNSQDSYWNKIIDNNDIKYKRVESLKREKYSDIKEKIDNIRGDDNSDNYTFW